MDFSFSDEQNILRDSVRKLEMLGRRCTGPSQIQRSSIAGLMGLKV